MRKKLVIVFIGLLCFLGLFAGCGEKNEVLAIGMKTLPTTLTYTVGQPIDVDGGKVAVVFSEEPEVVQVVDLNEEMLDKASYDINLTGVKNVVVNYTFEGKEYHTEFRVEYFERPFKDEAIKDINAYNAAVVYAEEEADLVALYKSLAVANIRVSYNAEEAKSVVDNAKAKISKIPTKASLDAQSGALLSNKEAAKNTVDGYKATTTVTGAYAEIVATSKAIAKAEINFASDLAEINFAVSVCKASVDSAILGNKTLDDINNAKIAAVAAKDLAVSAKTAAETAAQLSSDKATAAETAKNNALAAKTAAETAKATAETAQAAAQTAQAKAEAAKTAAEAIKADVTATKAQVDEALAKAKTAQTVAETAKAAAETAKAEAVTAKTAAKLAETNAKAAQTAAEAAKAAAQLAETNAKAAQTGAEAAQTAAEAAKAAAQVIYDQIRDLYDILPEAQPAIDALNAYVNNADYSGVELLLVQTIKASYTAELRTARTVADVNNFLTAAKAVLDTVVTDTTKAANALLELPAAKANAKALFAAYVNLLEYSKPAEVGTTYPDFAEPDPAEAELLAKINALITDVEARIDAATTKQEVEEALAYGQGKSVLETLYVDYYSSYCVRDIKRIVRAQYEPIKLSYSVENWEKIEQIVDYYENLIGRLDKIDQLAAKYRECLDKLDAIKTQSQQLADMIYAVELPVVIKVAERTETPLKDTYDDQLKAINDKLAEFDVPGYGATGLNTRVLTELQNYPKDDGTTEDVLALFVGYVARYNGTDGLTEAKAQANTALTGEIALIDLIPGLDALTLTDKTTVTNARTAYDAWINKFFTLKGYTATAEPLNLAIIYNYQELVDAEARIAQLEAAKVAAEATPAGVIALIEAVDDPNGYVVLANEDSITAARTAYDAWLVDYEINTPNEYLVTNLTKLTDAEARLAELKAAKVNAEADGGVIALINAILGEGDYITLDASKADAAEIAAAQTAKTTWETTYHVDPLAEPVNEQIISNLAKLEKYVERYQELTDAKTDAETPVTGVIALITALPAHDNIVLADEPQIEAAKTTYETWINTYFTAKGYVADDEPLNTAIVNNYATLKAALDRIAQLKSAQTAAADVDALIILTNDPNNYVVLANEESITTATNAYNEWLATYEITNDTNKAMVTKYAELQAAIARLAELQAAKANAEADGGVIALIDDVLTDGEYITLSSKTKIEAAEAAKATWEATYHVDPTTEPINGAIINNVAELAPYRDRYDTLVAAKANAETAITGAIALIDTISVPVTLASKADIDNARAEYNTWETTYFTNEGFTAADEPLNTAIVSNYAVLDAAEVKYKELTDLRDTTETLINDIGTISIDSETSIAAAEAKFLELQAANNNDDPSSYVTSYTNMLTARNEFEVLLYGKYRDAMSQVVATKKNEIISQMGVNRDIADRENVGLAAVTGMTAAYAISKPTAPSPFALGAYDRTGYTASYDSLQETTLDNMYKAAIYLATGTAEEGYDVTVYVPGTYTSFTPQTGAAITTVKDLTVDELVGLGHVVYDGITVTGNVYVNGGGSSSVVFKNSILSDVIVAYPGVRVKLDENTTCDLIKTDPTKLDVTDQIIIEFNNTIAELNLGCNTKIEGIKPTEKLIINVEDAITIETTLLDLEINKPDDVESFNYNGKEFKEPQVGVDETGLINLTPGKIEEYSACNGGSDLTSTVTDQEISFGGENTKIIWSQADELTGAAGYKFAVKIYAPESITDFSDLICIAEKSSYISTVQVDENGDEYIIVTYNTTEAPKEYSIRIYWTNPGSLKEISYTVKLLEGTSFDLSAGTLSFDTNKLAGPEATSTLNGAVLTIDGILKYYAKDEIKKLYEDSAIETNNAGYYVDYRISPDPSTGEADVFGYCEVTLDLLANGKTMTYTWGADAKPFTYEIKFADTLLLETPEASVEKKDDVEYADMKFAFADSIITISGKVPFFPALEEAGRAEGHRVGLAITPVEGIALSDATLYTVDGREVPFYEELVLTNNVLYYYPQIEDLAKEYTFVVKWNSYAEKQEYTINFVEAELVVPAATEVVIADGKTELKTDVEELYTASVLSKFAPQEVVWTSSNEEVATVKDGTVLTLKPGTVTIKAAAKDNEEVYDEIVIEVSCLTVAEAIALAPATTEKVNVQFQGTVVALQYNGFYVADEKAVAFIYDTTAAKDVALNDVYLVKGLMQSYKNTQQYCPEVTNVTLTKLEGELPYAFKAEELSLELVSKMEISSYDEAKDADLFGKLLTINGTLRGSGYYWWITEESGKEFYISNSFGDSAKELVAGCEAEIQVLAREVYFINDSKGNFVASSLGGPLIKINALYAKDFIVDAAYDGADKVVDGLTYKAGKNIFTSLTDAYAAAKDGTVINLVSGTYADSLTIEKAVKLVGPNNKVAGNAERAAEAKLTGVLSVGAVDGLELLGLNLTEKANVEFVGAANNTKIAYCVIDSTINNAIHSASSVSTSNLTYEYNLLVSPKDASNRTFRLEGLITNASVTNSVFTVAGEHSGLFYLDAVRFNQIAGEINISDNDFTKFYTDNWTIFLGSVSNKCTSIKINNNIIDGSSSTPSVNYCCGICVRNIPADCPLELSNNTFYKTVGTLLDIKYAATATAVATFKNNLFETGLKLNIVNVSGDQLKFRENYIVAGSVTYDTGSVNIDTTVNHELVLQAELPINSIGASIWTASTQVNGAGLNTTNSGTFWNCLGFEANGFGYNVVHVSDSGQSHTGYLDCNPRITWVEGIEKFPSVLGITKDSFALFHGIDLENKTLNNPVVRVFSIKKVAPEVTVTETEYDFVTNFKTYGESWSNSYASYEISSSDLGEDEGVKFVLSNASKQIGTITDRPTLCAKKVDQFVTITSTDIIKEVSVDLKMWTAKKEFQYIKLQYTTDGEEWIDCTDDTASITGAVAEDGSTISAVITAKDVKSVRVVYISTSTSNTQLGLTSVTLKTEK